MATDHAFHCAVQDGVEVFTRYGIEIAECPACHGYGTRDGRPARDHDRRQGLCRPCGGTGEDLDALTRELTAFASFDHLLRGSHLKAPARTGYRPSFVTGRGKVTPDSAESRRKVAALADAYDQAQANRGDNRVAERGS